MTLIHTGSGEKLPTMEDTRIPNKEEAMKTSRPIRSRRFTRRSIAAGHRPQKRLFTPEIKRYLKDWLVRRRENPYPNRDEKKHLSRETGLTYIQICNWFANWRRKLKNVNEERNQQTWGHLIRTYNDRAQGNVEQFSICSEDSIWSEPELGSPQHESVDTNHEMDDSPEELADYRHNSVDSSTSSTSREKIQNLNNNSYNIDNNGIINEGQKNLTSPLLLSKWLESAARFQPSESNYSWWDGRRRRPEMKAHKMAVSTTRHDRAEVEAAVALTALATATARLTAL